MNLSGFNYECRQVCDTGQVQGLRHQQCEPAGRGEKG